VTYWLRGTFAAADRIAAVDGAANHSVNGLVTRLLGPGPAATAVYLVCAAALVVVTLALAVRLAGRGEELLAVGLCGLGAAAAAPFAWSHHWVWVVPVLVALAARRSWPGVGVVLAATFAFITALPGPVVGPIPSTGSISWFPDAYLAMFVVLLVLASADPRRASSR
jgi:alpha-1,2-mannosyltransferase